MTRWRSRLVSHVFPTFNSQRILIMFNLFTMSLVAVTLSFVMTDSAQACGRNRCGMRPGCVHQFARLQPVLRRWLLLHLQQRTIWTMPWRHHQPPLRGIPEPIGVSRMSRRCHSAEASSMARLLFTDRARRTVRHIHRHRAICFRRLTLAATAVSDQLSIQRQR